MATRNKLQHRNYGLMKKIAELENEIDSAYTLGWKDGFMIGKDEGFRKGLRFKRSGMHAID